MKTVLITGASGFLGSHIIQALRNDSRYELICVDICKEKIDLRGNGKALSTEDFFNTNNLTIDVVINCAFARGNDSAALVSALDFNEKLIQKLKGFSVGSIISISSQGIYRSVQPGEFADENGEIEPKEMYALAKYAQERLFTSNFGGMITNIRMASLSYNARFLQFFVDSVRQGKDIVVTAPHQYVSMIDVKDAVAGILKVLEIPVSSRAAVYNLGAGQQYSILELARLTNEIGVNLGYQSVKVHDEDNGKQAAVGMNCERLMNATGWKPQVDIREMIGTMFATQKG